MEKFIQDTQLDGSISYSKDKYIKNEAFTSIATDNNKNNDQTPPLLNELSQNKPKTFRLRMLGKIENIFEEAGGFAYDNSVALIFTSLLIAFLFATGIIERKVESDIYKLYGMHDSIEAKSKETYDSIFTLERNEVVLLNSENNLLNNFTLTNIDKMYEEITKITFPKAKILEDLLFIDLSPDSETYKNLPDIIDYEFVCLKDSSGNCIKRLCTDLYTRKEDYGKPISVPNFPYHFTHSIFEQMRIDSVLGNIEFNQTDNTIIGSTSILNLFILSGAQDIRPASATFELLTQNLIESWDIDPSIKLLPFMDRTLNDDLHEASILRPQDYIFIAVAISLVCLYAMFSKLNQTFRTKALVITLGVGLGLLAYLAGTGICYTLGLTHIAATESTPFVVIGIAADDTFIISNSYNLTYALKNPKQRIKKTLGNAGLSITITTITNIVAFIIGSFSPFYSIQIFCIVTSVCLTLGYILCITCFIPLLAISARKEFDERRCYKFSDFFPTKLSKKGIIFSRIFKSNKPQPPTTTEHNSKAIVPIESTNVKINASQGIESIISKLSAFDLIRAQHAYERHLSKLIQKKKNSETNLSSSPITSDNSLENMSLTTQITDYDHGSFRSPKEDSSKSKKIELIDKAIFNLKTEYALLEEPKGNSGRYIRVFLRKYTWRIFNNKAYSLIIISLFLVHLAVSAYFSTKLEFGIKHDEIVLANSRTLNYYDESKDSFSDFFEIVQIYFVEPVAWHNKETQDQLLAVNDEIKNHPNCTDLINGMYYFLFLQQHYLIDGNQTQFNEELRSWINGPIGSQFSSNFIFDESGNLKHFKFTIYMPFIDDTIQSFELYQEFLDIVKTKEKLSSAQSFTNFAMLWEGDVKILPITLSSLAMAHVAIFIMAFLLIPGLASPIFALAMILCIDISVFGHMAFWGIKLNMISMIILLLSIGYSVDYTVHILHALQHFRTKSTNDRTAQAVSLMAIPLFDGMLSTYMPVATLAFSDKYILYLFFQMLTIILVFSFLHGVVFLPTLYGFNIFKPKDKLAN